MENLQPADIFVTRNYLDKDNDTPGYWNHSAIYVGNYQIVEAQAQPKQVILSSYVEFYNRYPEIAVLRYKLITPKNADKIAVASMDLIGTPYWRLSSIFYIMRRASRGVNCVTVIRRAFKEVLSVDFGWKIPDRIYQDNRFDILFEKNKQ